MLLVLSWIDSNLAVVAAGFLHDYLGSFLQTTLPATKPGKKSKFVLGVSDHKIGNAIQVRSFSYKTPVVCAPSYFQDTSLTPT